MKNFFTLALLACTISAKPLKEDSFKTGYVNDWRDKVPDYRVGWHFNCGSSSAFAAITVQELMQYKMSASEGDKMQYLAVQQILECSDISCNGGGYVKQAWEHSKDKGTVLESDYGEYDERPKECRAAKAKIASKVKSHGLFDYSSEDPTDIVTKMSDYLYQVGPLTVAIQMHQSNFNHYQGDIVTQDGLDHQDGFLHDYEIALVGQGVEKESGTEYWILQNSWGKTWGEEGSIKIAKKGGSGLFGMNERVQWVELEEGYGLGYSNQAPSKP